MSDPINHRLDANVNKTSSSRQLCAPEESSQQVNQSSKESSHTRLIPLTDWSKYHAWPPLGGLRHMVFHGEKTGFARVTVKVGRRRLIDERKFFEFVAQKNLENQKLS